MIKKRGGIITAFAALFLSAAVTGSSFTAAGVYALEDGIELCAVDTPTAENNQPEFHYIAGIVLKVNFGSPNVFVSVAFGGYKSTSYRNGVITLTKLSGADAGTVKKWTGLSSGNAYFSFVDDTVKATVGAYRLSVSIIAVRDGKSEVVSGYIDVTYDGTAKDHSFSFGLGDLDNSGSLSAVDLTILMKIISGRTAMSGFQSYAADVNEDGVINTKDLTRLMKWIASGG